MREHRCVRLLPGWLFCLACAAEESVELDTTELVKLDIAQLFEVQIKSASGIVEALRQAPASVVVISADDIARHGYDNLVEILSDVPGFDIAISNGDFYANAYQRGYRTPFTQRTLFLIDGVVANELWSQSFDLSRQYPLQAIDRIEIVYGPGSAVYGANAYAGVVQIFSKKAANVQEGVQGETRLRSGSYNTRSLETELSAGAGEWRSRGFLRCFDSDEPALSDYHGFTGFSRARWLNNAEVWGPVLQLHTGDSDFGRYQDPSRMWSLLLNSEYQKWQGSLFWWRASEGYGLHYPGDKAQPDAQWQREAGQAYLQQQTVLAGQQQLTTRLSYRRSRWWSDWAEATPDWNIGMLDFSYVSYSHWATYNDAWQLEQQLELARNNGWQWLTGWKVQYQDLTRAYAACGYWEPESYCPQAAELTGDGPAGFGPWVVHSSDVVLPAAPDPADSSADNRVQMHDAGVYVQALYELGRHRFNAGLRYDRQNLYGSSISPRLAYILSFNDDSVLKLIYGRAWQEPAGIQVYGGWNGRAANEDLEPEKASNGELIFMRKQKQWLHELSLYQADYTHAIRESALNAGGRRVRGGEYRAHANLMDSGLPEGSKAYFFYTYTEAMDDQHFDAEAQNWVDGSAAIGDIARHKIQSGLSLPVHDHWELDLRARYTGERVLYGSNPLREQGERLPAYTVFDLNLRASFAAMSAALTINNLFDAAYEHPGVGAANAGIDDSQRSQGWSNSVLAQPGRSLFLSVALRY